MKVLRLLPMALLLEGAFLAAQQPSEPLVPGTSSEQGAQEERPIMRPPPLDPGTETDVAAARRNAGDAHLMARRAERLVQGHAERSENKRLLILFGLGALALLALGSGILFTRRRR